MEEKAFDKFVSMHYAVDDGQGVLPEKQGLCWEVLAETLIGLYGFHVTTRRKANVKTHIVLNVAGRDGD